MVEGFGIFMDLKLNGNILPERESLAECGVQHGALVELAASLDPKAAESSNRVHAETGEAVWDVCRVRIPAGSNMTFFKHWNKLQVYCSVLQVTSPRLLRMSRRSLGTNRRRSEELSQQRWS